MVLVLVLLLLLLLEVGLSSSFAVFKQFWKRR
jgi:hypothetical protein